MCPKLFSVPTRVFDRGQEELVIHWNRPAGASIGLRFADSDDPFDEI
jgi:hypothetical protein